MIKSPNRRWQFPEKDEDFNTSYDYLLSWFQALDDEFGTTLDFLFKHRLSYFFDTETELKNFVASNRELAFVRNNGWIYIYNSFTKEWTKVEKKISLKRVFDRDPTSSDTGYIRGDVWVNDKSQRYFIYLGEFGLTPDTTKAVWLDINGNNVTATDKIKSMVVYPSFDFNYKTKRLTQNPDGSLTFDDDFSHINGKVDLDGIVHYPEYDTHIDFFIENYYVGTMPIRRLDVQTLVDLQNILWLPDYDHFPVQEEITPEHCFVFENLLHFLHVASYPTMLSFRRNFIPGLIFRHEIEEIVHGDKLPVFLSDNSLDSYTKEGIIALKENYRSVITVSEDLSLNVNEKVRAISFLGARNAWGGTLDGECRECFGFDTYDGNIYYINGNQIFVDGNIEPC